MATNTYKKNQSTGTRRIFFSQLENLINVEKFFDKGLPIQLLMPILFITILSIFYIGNLHYVEKNIRKTIKLGVIVEDLRADYTTLKADYMYASKQSEVVKKAKMLGLEESVESPHKIVVNGDKF